MKKHFMRTWHAVVCIALVLFAFSACRNKEPDDNKVPVTPDDALDTTSVESVTSFYNLYADRLAESFERSNGSKSAQLTDMLEQLSFSIDQITYIGNDDTVPELIIFKDRTFFTTGKEYNGKGDAVPYSEITKLYNDGMVSISSLNNEVSASFDTSLAIGSFTKEYDTEAFRKLHIGAGEITALQKEEVYCLEMSYIKKLTEAFGLTDADVASLGLTLEQFYNLTFTVDFSNYTESKTVKLSAAGNPLEKAIVLSVDMSEHGEHSGKTSVSLELPTSSIQAVFDWKDDSVTHADIKISLEETEINISYEQKSGVGALPSDTPRNDCNTTVLTVSVTADGNEQLALLLNAAELEGNHYAGSFGLTFGEGADNGGGVVFTSLGIPASDSSGVTAITGSFDFGFDKDDEFVSLVCDATAEDGSDRFEIELSVDFSDVEKKGSEVLQLRSALIEWVDGEKIENTAFITVKTEKCTKNKAEFSLVGTFTDGEEEESLMATLHWPACDDITLSEQEEIYLARADALFENYDYVTQLIDTLNESAINYVQMQMESGAPLKYYCYDATTNLYYFTDISVSNNQIYVSTVCVLDYEELAYYYALHAGDFAHYKDSEAMIEAKNVQRLIDDAQKGYVVYGNPAYLVSTYLPEKDVYLVMLAGRPETASYYKERITQEMVSGYVLHELVYSENGEVNIHNFSTKYDEWCRPHLTCNDCGLNMKSTESSHMMSEETEIRPGGDGESRATFRICNNCAEGYLTLTDTEGRQLRILLSLAERYSDIPYEYGELDLVIRGFEYVINGVYYQDSLNIPNIDRETDYRIVGAVAGDGYWYSLPEELVLPEGIEFVGTNAFYNCGFTTITLPLSLKSIGYGAFLNCRAEEIVIPENVTYVAEDAFAMEELERLIINAKVLDYFFWPYGAPNLKQIEYNGHIRYFGGSYTLNMETLVVPEGVTSVGSFQGNQYLKKIVLPSTLTSIEDYAFSNCSALEEVVLPAGLLNIGSYAFSDCVSLSRVWVSYEGITNGADGDFILPDTLMSLGAYAFKNCIQIETINIPSSVTVVPAGLFEMCEQLTTVRMNDNITDIEAYAFYYCIKLANISMPKSLTAIGDFAFSNCSLLTDENVVFGDKLQSIGDRSFERCYGISNLRFPESMQFIHDNALDKCQLDTVYVASKIVSFGSGGANINEITFAKGFLGGGFFPVAKVVNIMSSEVPQSDPHMWHNISGYVSVINFAGTEEDWNKGNYIVNPSTKVNFNVKFDKKSDS